MDLRRQQEAPAGPGLKVTKGEAPARRCHNADRKTYGARYNAATLSHLVFERAGPQMLTEEDRALVLSGWAALVSVVAIYFLSGSFWKAGLIGAFVGISSLLGYGTRWVLKGSFAIAVLAIAAALLPPPDQWLQLFHQVQEAVVAASRAGG
jgi:hypothetical protein